MSAFSFAYLFDYKDFEKKISTALDELVSGNSRKLQSMAIELAKDNPKIWEFIDLSRIYFHNFNLKKEEDTIVNAGILLWLLLIISAHCSEFSRSVVNFKILDETGTRDKSLGELLIRVSPKIIPIDYVDGKFNIENSPMYWLDLDDIEKIKCFIQADVQRTDIYVDDGFISMLDNALAGQKNIIVGFWIGM